jgi:allophanate hydrolase subunit 1
MQSLGSISFSISDGGIGRNDKIRVVVSITSPPGWRLISQTSAELIYQRIATGNEADSVDFEIRAFTTIES